MNFYLRKKRLSLQDLKHVNQITKVIPYKKDKLPYTTKFITYGKTNKSKQTIPSLKATPITLQYKSTIVIHL